MMENTPCVLQLKPLSSRPSLCIAVEKSGSYCLMLCCFQFVLRTPNHPKHVLLLREQTLAIYIFTAEALFSLMIRSAL